MIIIKSNVDCYGVTVNQVYYTCVWTPNRYPREIYLRTDTTVIYREWIDSLHVGGGITMPTVDEKFIEKFVLRGVIDRL